MSNEMVSLSAALHIWYTYTVRCYSSNLWNVYIYLQVILVKHGYKSSQIIKSLKKNHGHCAYTVLVWLISPSLFPSHPLLWSVDF